MGRHALIVEDEKDTAEILSIHLQQWGFESTILSEGKRAIPWVRLNKPDVILLDILLPDMDGFAICEILKLDRETNLIPVVMVTALCGQEDRVKGLQVGANRYLTKPFSAAQLQEAVGDVFQWQDEIRKRGTEGAIRFQMESDTKYLEELNDLLSSLFLFSGLEENQAKQFTTAVREMGTNAIEWGNKNKSHHIVTVDYHIDSRKIEVVVRDSGEGFDPKNMPHAAQPDDPIGHMMVRETLGLREGGFGILMSRGLVDEMEYNKSGNEVRLVKYFAAKNATGKSE